MTQSAENPYGLQGVERGVFRCKGAPEGYIKWQVFSRTGKLLREEMVAVEMIEDDAEMLQTERQLRRYLEIKDRRTHLKAV